MQQVHATCTWALTCKLCPCTSCMFLLHPAPAWANGCWCLVPLINFSNLSWWCFPSSQWCKCSNCTWATCTVWWWLCGGACMWWCLYVVVGTHTHTSELRARPFWRGFRREIVRTKLFHAAHACQTLEYVIAGAHQLLCRSCHFSVATW